MWDAFMEPVEFSVPILFVMEFALISVFIVVVVIMEKRWRDIPVSIYVLTIGTVVGLVFGFVWGIVVLSLVIIFRLILVLFSDLFWS